MAEYKPWYERFPERFTEEKTEMARRGFDFDKEAFARQAVVFTGRSKVDPERELKVECSDAFPSAAPRVLSNGGSDLLIAHQRPDTGEICTFGQRQVRWSAGSSAAAAIDEAEDVISRFSHVTTSSSDEGPEPVSDCFQYSEDFFFLLPQALHDSLNNIPATPITGTFRVFFEPRNQLPKDIIRGRGVITRITTPDFDVDAPKHFRKLLRGAYEKVGTLVILPQPPPHLRTTQELREWLGSIGLAPAEWMAFAFPEGGTSQHDFYWSWLVVHKRGPNIFFGRTLVLRSPQTNVRVPGMEGLSSKKVCLIGCGNLGSKIAAGLAATGVSRFFLLDRDYYHPDNSVRHEAGFSQFGLPKTHVIAGRICELNVSAFESLDGSVFQIGGVVNTEEQKRLFENVASADLVVDTTAVHGVSRFINELCNELKVPSIYASVTNGAWSGEIVRVVPGQTACWMCWLKQYEDNQPPSAPAPAVGVFAPGCNQPTFTGTTYETGIVANLATWMAVDTLRSNSRGSTKIDGDYLRWIGRDKDGAPSFTTQILTTAIAEDCWLCRNRHFTATSL